MIDREKVIELQAIYEATSKARKNASDAHNSALYIYNACADAHSKASKDYWYARKAYDLLHKE